MGIPRRQARAVIQQNLVAIAIVPAGNDYRTAVGGQDRRTLRRGNIRSAMAGVTVSVVIPKIAGYVGVTGQRPAEFAVLDDADAAAEGKQRGAHFIGEKFVQYIVLVLGEIVQLGQLIHGFAVDGDMKDVFSLLLRVGVVLGGFGSDVYFFDLVGDLVHSSKGVLDALHLGGIDNDNVAIRVEVGMYCKDGQHLRPVACPCMTVLVVVGDGGFAALRVGGYDVIDGCAETVTETSVYKGYKQDKIEMRGDRAEMSDFPLYLNTVAGGLDRRDQTIGGFSFVVKIYTVPVVEIIG